LRTPDGMHLPSSPARLSLREQVLRGLRAAVVSGELAAGVVYSIPALARQFGVSATPVREALLELARDGTVQPVRNKGFRVSTMSDQDLDQVAAIRELLEPAGIAAATQLASPGDLEALRPLAQRIVTAARDGHLITYLEADRDFHLRLLSLSGNKRLVDVVGLLRAQTRLFGLAPLAERGVLVHSAHEHLALLEVMAKGDAQAAEALVARHIGHVRGVWAGRGEK